MMKKFIGRSFVLANWVLAPFWLIGLLFFCVYSRFKTKTLVGIGPEPLINNKYHKQALLRVGYKAETFVNQVYFITDDFDVRGDLVTELFLFRHYWLFILALCRYKIVYFYFNGGPLAWTPLRWM